MHNAIYLFYKNIAYCAATPIRSSATIAMLFNGNYALALCYKAFQKTPYLTKFQVIFD